MGSYMCSTVIHHLIHFCQPFGAKIAVFGHKRLQTPQMAGKSGLNGGSQLNTCRRTDLDAKLIRITHPVVWKWLQSGPFGAKIADFGHKRLQTPQMAGKSDAVNKTWPQILIRW